MIVNQKTIATLSKAILDEIACNESNSLTLEVDSKITLVKTFIGSGQPTTLTTYGVFLSGKPVGEINIDEEGITLQSVTTAVRRFVGQLVSRKVEEIVTLIVSERAYDSTYRSGKLAIFHGNVGMHSISVFQVELNGKLVANLPGSADVVHNDMVWRMLRQYIKNAVMDGDIEVAILE